MRSKHRRLRLIAASAAISLLASVGLALPALPASAAGGPNLAAGKTASASSSNGAYAVGNVNDGNQATYWESSGTSLPQWAQVDLGGSTSVDQVVLKLPAGWGARTETLTVLGSTDGTNFSPLVGSAGYSFDPASNNVVTIDFAAANTRYVRVSITANTGWSAAQLSELEVHGATASASPNLALGKTLTASSSTSPYTAARANDGDQATYWESANNTFPQWIQVDLGSTVKVNTVVLKLPAGWGARTETLKVQDSTDGNAFSDVVASAAYAFNPASANAATINFPQVTTRYLRLNITANSAWPAGQLSEFEVYGPAQGVDTQPPTAPGNLAYTQPVSGQIKLTWSASTDNVGVTGYDVYANGTLRTSVAGTVLTYTDTQPTSDTVSYYVKAKDAAGNVSPQSNTVTRTGDTSDHTPPTAPGNLAYTQPASGQIKLTWSASTDNVGVTGYDVYANDVLRASVAGNVLTYTDNQPDSATVAYYVKAKDAAANVSAQSNTVTRAGTVNGSNLAVGKAITASSSILNFVATNANDDSVTTYWEGASGSYPNTLSVNLRLKADLSAVVVKLNPDSAWGTRTQTIEVLGRADSTAAFTQLSAPAVYTFNPATGNSVSIPVTGRVAEVQLKITTNSGAGAGQVAEFQVIGTPAPTPDLTITDMAWSPTSPIETDAVTLKATVKNIGTAAAPASDVNFYLADKKVGTAPVGALAAGASETVSLNIAARDAGSYPLSAKVDEADLIIELNELNNSFANPSPLVIAPVSSSDLVAAAVGWTPGNPGNGDNVTFSVAIKNQGTISSASGAHGITLTILDATTNAVVKTLTGSYTGAIASGATTGPVNLGTWTAVNGKYNVKVVLDDDANEVPMKRTNNTSTQPFFVGRGANMPYDTYEAEDGVVSGGATVVGPNRNVGDVAGEASGRKAVTLNTTGSSVEFTTRASTNTLVTRFSIPDAAGGGGINSTLNVYVNGSFLKAIDLTSHYAWLYGSETSPGNTPDPTPRHIYDEANIMLGTTVPAGSKIKLQKDAANTSTYAIDFINLEQVSPIANPDPAKYAVPAGFTQQNVQDAIDKARQDATLVGVYLPPGDYQTANKFQIYGKAMKIVGAGPWYTRFRTPTTQDNTDAGFRADATANGSTFSGFAFFGNYTSRIDGPGKVFDLSDVANMVIDNIWVEHTVCMYWGTNTDNMTIKNSRIRNTFADGINMTNGSTGNTVSNIEARATGDDSFALFSATDHNAASNSGNVFENLTSILTWRAASVAVYGGFDNTFRNIYIADTLVYSGITISSLDFGIPMNGFGATPTTNFQNISVVRSGGHFWGKQVFPAVWLFSASKVFQGIRVSDVDIVDPTYSGIMFQTNYSGGQPQNPVTDTVFTNVSITGAQKNGDAYGARSGYAIWANELPEPGQGPAVGSATFNNLKLTNNFIDFQNTTSTFTFTRNP